MEWKKSMQLSFIRNKYQYSLKTKKMKTNKKVWAAPLFTILLGITAYCGYHTYNKYQEINESLLTLRDVEVLAQNESGSSSGKQYHIDNPLPCTITEYFNCHIGITIPDWIPYVGGTSCEADFTIPYSSEGTDNLGEYTGNVQHSCDYFRCRKNG